MCQAKGIAGERVQGKLDQHCPYAGSQRFTMARAKRGGPGAGGEKSIHRQQRESIYDSSTD